MIVIDESNSPYKLEKVGVFLDEEMSELKGYSSHPKEQIYNVAGHANIKRISYSRYFCEGGDWDDSDWYMALFVKREDGVFEKIYDGMGNAGDFVLNGRSFDHDRGIHDLLFELEPLEVRTSILKEAIKSLRSESEKRLLRVDELVELL